MDRRSRRSREAIVAAFTRLFFEHGYDALSVSAIAQAADVGRSTFYLHFRRKQDVLRASMAIHLQALADSAFPGNEEELGRLLRHFWENRRHRRIFGPGECRTVLATGAADLIEVRLRGSESGQVCSISPGVASQLVADHQLSFIYRWLNGHVSLSPDVATAVMQRSVLALMRSLC